jgi:poly(A) polymerase
MTTIVPTQAREFAQQVVEALRDSGYESLWAGGCVRDQLLGLQPKDYDVATNATPDQIRAVFGKHRTLAIGAAFGVITVLGSKASGPVEVATFRRDAGYSDGRHPDSISFSNAKEDALRRDFTINGLFYDPLTDEVIDYVGGRDDIARKVVRAIGDPEERISEDKLRMLRAVRFATTLGFEIETETMLSVQRHANELQVVSAERVSAELRRLLCHSNRRLGLELLRTSGLLAQVLPELDCEAKCWNQTLEIEAALHEPSFAVAAAVLLRVVSDEGVKLAESICRRWKLSNEEIAGVLLCLKREAMIRNARNVAWPNLQRVLTLDRVNELLDYCEAVATVVDGEDNAVRHCRNTIARPRSEWNPTPLIAGDDLKQLGIPAGPAYRELLTTVRDSQLKGEITVREEALEMARTLWKVASS